MIRRMLIYWYNTQTVCIKWIQCFSSYFIVSSGLKQDSISFPKLHSLYMDDWSHILSKFCSGCFFDNVSMKHIIYADDISLFGFTPSNLQKLPNICKDFWKANSITFNSLKYTVYLHLTILNFFHTYDV